MIKLNNSFQNVYLNKSIEFFFRFFNLYLMSILYGEIFMGSFSIILSFSAFAQSIGSLFDASSLRFFYNYDLRGKLNWFFSVFSYKAFCSTLLISLLSFFFYKDLFYSEYFDETNFEFSLIFLILLSSVFDSFITFFNNILISSKKFINGLKISIIFFLSKFFIITIFIFLGTDNFEQSLIIILYTPFLLSLIYFVNTLHSHFTLENFKKIDFFSFYKLFKNILKKYTIFDLIKLPISYFKTNIFALISPVILNNNLIFVFIILNKIFYGLSSLFSSVSASFVNASHYENISIFKTRKLFFIVTIFSYIGIFVIAYYLFTNVYIFELSSVLIIFFLLKTLELIIVTSSVPYSVKIMSTSNIRPFIFLLLLPDIITMLVVLIFFSEINVLFLGFVFLFRVIFGLGVFIYINNYKL